MQFSTVQDSLQWDPFRAGDTTVSERAVLAGDEDGKPVYVGRVKHKKGWLLGKVRASAGRVAASYGGKEHQYTSGELLVLSGDQMPIWVDAADGAVPAHAVGCPSPDRPGEQEFVGRAEHHGTYMSGKVVPWHHCLYLPWSGKEHAYRSYQVLTVALPLRMMRPENSRQVASSGLQSTQPGNDACSSCHRRFGPPAGLAQSAGNSTICQDCAEDNNAQQDPVLNSLSDPSHTLPVSHGGGFHPPDSNVTDDVPEN